MSGRPVRVGPYATPPPLGAGATRATGRDELAELRAEIAAQLASIGEIRGELADLGRRLGELERIARVAASDREDRAGLVADLRRRLAELETRP